MGFRGEYIGDADGVILGSKDGNVLSMTLSGNIYIGGLTFIPEFRVDMANDKIFPDGDSGDFSDVLAAFVFAAIYDF